MRGLACALLLTLVAFAGCTPHPLTDSEFRGFCYTSIEGRFSSCDTIPMCDTFDSQVLSAKHASQEACNQACQDVYNNLYRSNMFIGCGSTLQSANNWCLKYCSTNYPR